MKFVFPRYVVKTGSSKGGKNMGKYVATDLTTIYQAPTADQAEMELMAFEEKWDKTHPTIGQTWRRNWELITPFFAYPPDIRKVIYTTNAIESQNMSLRKVTKN
jgi:putative transposase